MLELVGWEEKKIKLWNEDKPKEKSLLHRYGGWLFFPMGIFGGESNRISGNDDLGWILVSGTIVQ